MDLVTHSYNGFPTKMLASIDEAGSRSGVAQPAGGGKLPPLVAGI
jgi:hypothetical protein